ncbi:MAG TPA: nuclear transport factor 2 family protein [Ktedonobacteraceae bacterium]|nr:nuclear transport factor 2 family protein [Ktedonobacteraceae bacterium]
MTYRGQQHGPTPSSGGKQQNLNEQIQIIRITAQFAHFLDARAWIDLRALFTDTIDTDFTASGVGIAPQPADHIVGDWQLRLGSLSATHHMITNHLVDIDDDTAICRATAQAQHVLNESNGDQSFFTVGSTYRFHLRRRSEGDWLITAFALKPLWTAGNPDIFQRAATARASVARETLQG